MSTLEQIPLALDPADPHKQAAIGRFFCTQETLSESLYTRIHRVTIDFLDYYRLRQKQNNLYVTQLAKSNTQLVGLTERTDQHTEVASLIFNGAGLTTSALPLWNLTLARRVGGRESHKLFFTGHLHVITQFYDVQGRHRDTRMFHDVASVWNAVETLLDHPETHENITNNMKDEHFIHANSISAEEYIRAKQVPSESDIKERFVCDSSYTPEEAHEVLTWLFGGTQLEVNDRLYRDGRFHIVNQQKFNTPEATFYMYIEMLSERAAQRFDTPN